MTPISPTQWLIVDPLWTHMEVAIVDLDGVDRVLTYAASKGTILKAYVRPQPVRIRTLCTCVTFVKHLLGDRSWAITPWQLYRSMRRSGAVRAFYRSD